MGIPLIPDSEDNHISLSHHRRTFKVTRTYRELVKKRVLKQEMRVCMKMRRIHEYRRLRSMVPSIAKRPHVPKVTVIEEAIRYIDHLHNALLMKLRTRGLPSCLQGVNIDMNNFGHPQLQDLVRHLMNNSKTSSINYPACFSGSACQKIRSVPSYLLRKRKKQT